MGRTCCWDVEAVLGPLKTLGAVKKRQSSSCVPSLGTFPTHITHSDLCTEAFPTPLLAAPALPGGALLADGARSLADSPRANGDGGGGSRDDPAETLDPGRDPVPESGPVGNTIDGP